MSRFANASMLIQFFMLTIFGFSSIVSAAAISAESETIYLDETFISGNQELPKVLYILPWKNQSTGAVSAAKPRSSLDRVMTLVYPHEYRLELAFRSNAGIRGLPVSANVTAPSASLESKILINPVSKTNQLPAEGNLNELGLTQSILKED